MKKKFNQFKAEIQKFSEKFSKSDGKKNFNFNNYTLLK